MIPKDKFWDAVDEEKNEYWADRRCCVCDRHLDRRGGLCSECWEKERAEWRIDDEAKIKKVMEPWEFLNNQLQKLFAPKK